MNLSGLTQLLVELPAWRRFLDEARAGQHDRAPLALYGAARAFVAASLALSLERPMLYLVARSEHARQVCDELQVWLPSGEASNPAAAAAGQVGSAERTPLHYFADPDSLPYERVPWSRETRQARLGALTALAQLGAGSGPLLVVASARSLMQKTLPPRELRLALKTLRVGQMVDLQQQILRWLGLGYRSDAVVEEVGQLSRRGGIVDIWPPNLPWPVRIELFGDEIDSLRHFDPATQRTLPDTRGLREVLVGPASEAMPRYGAASQELLEALDRSSLHPPARFELDEQRRQLLDGTGFRGQEWYIPYLYSQPASLLDYLPPDALVLVDDGADLMVLAMELEAQAGQTQRDLITGGDLPTNPLAPHFVWQELKAPLLARGPLLLGYGDLEGRNAPAGSPLARHFVPGPRFGGQVKQIVAEVEKQLQQGQRVAMITRQAPRLSEIFQEEADRPLTVEESILAVPAPHAVHLVKGVLNEGWVLRGLADRTDGPERAVDQDRQSSFHSFLLYSDAELFGWTKPSQRRVQRPRAMAPEAFFADVSPGDYVVHMEHGIGQFAGLVSLDQEGGGPREYLQIDYAMGDRLFVPVHQADRLSRYVGAGEQATPILHRLGAADWERVKKQTKKAVDDIAGDLLQLYAAREAAEGHAFSADGAWQLEMEAAFPYEETPDQLVAIEAVKHDMESSQPMDRLICGDVGYGKTEVALRSAFKAVMDGKQVAVLTPTTVLAQQHFQTFSRRLAAFPVTVEMLSRFRTAAQQTQVVDRLAKGGVDIVIGTHRLLSKDVVFKDLGLLIVDEEQRFGVTHKERIKQMRQTVDVLTLTATPIPRTLHMSMTGVRDLSTIETPPEERLPIQTTIGEYDETLIRQAILREIDRGGQVFFVHNRVRGISQVAHRLERLIPEATYGIAHGQMPERELERVMLAFAEGQFNVLVCTTIIESGLDIPNANTIIINRADKFGLAQLYQLRGRVGRAAVRAYAYLLYERHQTLTPIARERLTALQEASELGAGFRIAMRDLEIRGAGELLGRQQHGHIAAVGFDLYCRLLAKSVEEMKRGEGRRKAGERGRWGDAEMENDGEADERVSTVRRSTSAAARSDAVSFEDPLAPAVTLDLPLRALLPEEYVAERALRLRLYRRIAGVTDTAALEALAEELVDRFGPLPEEVQNLFYQVRIKLLALTAGVTAIGHDSGQLVLKSDDLEQVDRQRLQARIGDDARVARRAIWLPIGEGWPEALERTLRALRAAQL
ncbi:MAG TPA: transcription-repair coupling factor [Anaerolineae bacterium]|nr:transcription-repair coupling factor [Anaerolineae bacterium]HNU05340.1 transcription-repair coupling factor [Anaerolineae bacterium]